MRWEEITRGSVRGHSTSSGAHRKKHTLTLCQLEAITHSSARTGGFRSRIQTHSSTRISHSLGGRCGIYRSDPRAQKLMCPAHLEPEWCCRPSSSPHVDVLVSMVAGGILHGVEVSVLVSEVLVSFHRYHLQAVNASHSQSANALP